MANLQNDIKFLSGVGPKKAELLKKELNIHTFEDLLYYFPYKYDDRTKFYKISQIHPDLPYIQLKGRITNFRTIGEGRKMRLVANFTDGEDTLELVWFKGLKWVKETYKTGIDYVVFGKPSSFNNEVNLVHPEIEEKQKYEQKTIKTAFEAGYNTTEKLKKSYVTSKTINRLQQNLLKSNLKYVTETLPEYILKGYELLSLQKALLNIHFPQNSELLQKARYRLKFEELFYIQLKLLKKKLLRENDFKGFVFPKVGDYLNTFYKENLPFDLTNAQKRVIKEIRKDLSSGKHMNRLLQGDVGSGKTLVALMTMLIALDNDFQACLMAPTEILAQQHFATLSKFLKKMDIRIALLTGSTKKSERKPIYEQLENGEMQIIVGTHALIEETVKFKNLGLAIIDEQHRFGVAQRAKLWQKNTCPPHVLVMTATPIPRTLAMTLYGDLEVSVIDEMPPGRKPVKTAHRYDSQRLRVFGFLKKQIDKGQQIYIVYPLISESEKMDYKDLQDGYESITRAFPPPKYAVSIVHGQMKPNEKEKAMQLFLKKQTQIMVATTVIEVGVDVPNASVMVIESAERFGLSQLHQLRGRVGRGAKQSYCILMTPYKLSAEARKRLSTMVRTSDGFEIAETDLKLRGPGDLQGTQQSGVPINLKIANLAKDGAIIQLARNLAMEILRNDPELKQEKNTLLNNQIKKTTKDKINWGVIS